MAKRLSLLHRLTASASRLDADELQEQVEQRRCVPLRELKAGGCVEVVGRLRSVVYTPSETVPTLEAELFDGSDSVALVWLGFLAAFGEPLAARRPAPLEARASVEILVTSPGDAGPGPPIPNEPKRPADSFVLKTKRR